MLSDIRVRLWHIGSMEIVESQKKGTSENPKCLKFFVR